MRLGKFLATAGVASRRASEEIIRQGRVTVNGQVVTDPAHDVDADADVQVDGGQLGTPTERVVYLVNKPPGVVSTASDPQGRPTVVSLVAVRTRLYPVGRLDADSTGLILLTNDGDLAHHLTHPRFQVPKTYRAVVGHAPVRGAALRALRDGVPLEDGLTSPAEVRLVKPDTLELTIREGRKRQVRRMCDAVGHPVRSLVRIRFGPLELGGLRPGAHRRLTDREVRALAGSGAPPARSGASPSIEGGRRRRGRAGS
jgi:23S rRNA pseudouridine2605 synthase